MGEGGGDGIAQHTPVQDLLVLPQNTPQPATIQMFSSYLFSATAVTLNKIIYVIYAYANLKRIFYLITHFKAFSVLKKVVSFFLLSRVFSYSFLKTINEDCFGFIS